MFPARDRTEWKEKKKTRDERKKNEEKKLHINDTFNTFSLFCFLSLAHSLEHFINYTCFHLSFYLLAYDGAFRCRFLEIFSVPRVLHISMVNRFQLSGFWLMLLLPRHFGLTGNCREHQPRRVRKFWRAIIGHSRLHYETQKTKSFCTNFVSFSLLVLHLAAFFPKQKYKRNINIIADKC